MPTSPGGISSDIVFVLLGLNCLAHKVGLIINCNSILHAMVSPGNFGPHLLTLLSLFPSIALGSQVCTLYTYLSARNTLYRSGSLGAEDLFFILCFLSMCICRGGGTCAHEYRQQQRADQGNRQKIPWSPREQPDIGAQN